jgi:hypothetical protein
MADMREMDADLMFASGARNDSQQREIFFLAHKSSLDKKFRLRRRARPDTIFYRDNATLVFAERRVYHPLLCRDVAVDDGEIFFPDGATFENFSEFTGDFGIFCDQNHAARLAVEPVDQMRLRGISQMQTRAPDQTGHLAVFRWMTDESGRLVDDQQFRVFKNDVKKFFHNLSSRLVGVSFAAVKEKWNKLLSILFVAVFAVSRIPGLLPQNFSVVYVFMFCAGVYFPKRTAWWLPLGVTAATDILLNIFYYHVAPLGFYLLLNYAIYAALIALGKWFGPRASFFKLLLGGLLGAVIFYLVTNTLTWLQDPFYTKTIVGWLQAMTVGHPDFHPTTWEFFRNTLLSGGIFTALFVGAEKLTSSAESPADKTAGAREAETEAEEASA